LVTSGETNEINVAAAIEDPNSIFYTYQKLIQLRKNRPIITEGTFQTIDTKETSVLAYMRLYKEEKLLVVVNFSNEKKLYTLDDTLRIKEVLIHNYDKKVTQELLPYEAYAVLLT